MVVGTILDSHIRASHTATRARDAFLKGVRWADTAIRSILSIGCGVELSLTTFLALQTKRISGAALNRILVREVPTCKPSKLGGPTSMLVGGKEMFASHIHDPANGRQAGQ